jgi:hypothetical protein
MKLVVLETPFAGDRKKNLDYARRCVRHCFDCGEAPFASHLLYTQMLEDSNETHRNLGITAGLQWGECASDTVVYTDLGISEGMQKGIMSASLRGRTIEFRKLPEKYWGIELPEFPTG